MLGPLERYLTPTLDATLLRRVLIWVDAITTIDNSSRLGTCHKPRRIQRSAFMNMQQDISVSKQLTCHTRWDWIHRSLGLPLQINTREWCTNDPSHHGWTLKNSYHLEKKTVLTSTLTNLVFPKVKEISKINQFFILYNRISLKRQISQYINVHS